MLYASAEVTRIAEHTAINKSSEITFNLFLFFTAIPFQNIYILANSSIHRKIISLYIKKVKAENVKFIAPKSELF